MLRFVLTLTVITGITALTFMQDYGLALCAGVASGALLFLPGAVSGARLGNTRAVGQAVLDSSMRLGACLALAGIAAAGQGHEPPLTLAGRIVIGMGQLTVSALAVILAWRGWVKADNEL